MYFHGNTVGIASSATQFSSNSILGAEYSMKPAERNCIGHAAWIKIVIIKGTKLRLQSAFPDLFSAILLMWKLIIVIIKQVMQIQGERKQMMSCMYAQQAVLQLTSLQTSLLHVCAISSDAHKIKRYIKKWDKFCCASACKCALCDLGCFVFYLLTFRKRLNRPLLFAFPRSWLVICGHISIRRLTQCSSSETSQYLLAHIFSYK